MTEPIIAGEVSSPLDPTASTAAHPLKPFGIVATFGWAIGAFAIATAAGAAVLAIVVLVTKELNDDDILLVASVATILAESTFVGVILWACRRRGWRAADYLGLTRPRGNYLRWSLLAFLLALAVSTLIANLGPLGDPSRLNDLFSSAVSIFWVVVAGPIGEELLFRGFLYRGIAASRLGIVGAILVTSLLWAGIHTDRTWLGFADLLFTGVALGWLRWRSDSTITVTAVHSVKNFVAVATYFFHP